jgi:RAP1 GTPase activating protein 1
VCVLAITLSLHSRLGQFRDFEVMFHVAPLLPHSDDDAQQLARKRHVGNDIVVLVYNDCTQTPFDPAVLTSKFNHIFIVLQRDAQSTPARYKVAVACKSPMIKFGE